MNRLAACALAACMGVAHAQNVKVTFLGTHAGELCSRDRATIFEDPTGLRILYDPGQSVLGAEDPRLGTIHVVPGQDRQVDCSFCGKKRHQVAEMAARAAGTSSEVPGPAAICDECLSLCDEILIEELT